MYSIRLKNIHTHTSRQTTVKYRNMDKDRQSSLKQTKNTNKCNSIAVHRINLLQLHNYET